MLTANDTYLYETQGWTLRIRPPERLENARLLLLLHGHTGDENVMWIFAQRLPKDYWILAPRAPIKNGENGYSWLPSHVGLDATMSDFQPAVEALLAHLKTWAEAEGTGFDRMSLMGFSQGAALSYALGLMHPEIVERIAGLAGFLPKGASPFIDRKPLAGKPIFVAHGTLDDTVPIEIARQSVHQLEKAGGLVEYCEEPVGHKLSRNCFAALTGFFK